MTKKKQKLVTTVTIREIEAVGPCRTEYAAFLDDFKAMPVPDGPYADEDMASRITQRRKPQYGPDDPIKLSDILARKKTTGYDSADRVAWLLGWLPSLRATAIAITERQDEIEVAAKETAMREVLG